MNNLAASRRGIKLVEVLFFAASCEEYQPTLWDLGKKELYKTKAYEASVYN